MKKCKPFFFRLEPLQLMTALIQIPEHERGGWITKVSIELATGSPNCDFAKMLFDEAAKYQDEASKRNRVAGLASAAKRQHKSTSVEQVSTSVEQVSTELNPVSSNRSSNSSNKEKAKEKNQLLECFEKLWERYPNRDGRKAAEKHFLTTVKTVDDARRVWDAMSNYLADLEDNPWKKAKNGSTWFNNWQDWEVTE